MANTVDCRLYDIELAQRGVHGYENANPMLPGYEFGVTNTKSLMYFGLFSCNQRSYCVFSLEPAPIFRKYPHDTRSRLCSFCILRRDLNSFHAPQKTAENIPDNVYIPFRLPQFGPVSPHLLISCTRFSEHSKPRHS